MIAAFLQAVVNGALAGSVLALPALGFNTVYAVLRFPNFAVAGLATIGAYAGWVANALWGWPAPAAILAAFVAGGAAGALCDAAALKPLRPLGALAAAIGSVALNIVLENAVRFAFGNNPRGYDLPVFRDWRFGAIGIGPQEVEDAAIALLAMAAVFLLLRTTRIGKAMRAVSDNATLAESKGIDPVRVAWAANILGLGLCGIGGMLVALDTSLDPLTGFRVLLSIFAAAVVGGLGSIPGAVAGAFVVGIGEELSTLVVAPTYRTAMGFLAILIVLSFRPRGLLGERAY
ncbi:MAG: branched-chain amino acid ABC transporter permease [Rhodospirillales bacterium]|nr:branched-chain amino acid ABC transporter permease [Rhodospirillales bacterium]